MFWSPSLTSPIRRSLAKFYEEGGEKVALVGYRPLWLNLPPALYRRPYGRIICRKHANTPRATIHFRRVEYGSGSVGEISYPYSVRTDLRKMGMLAMSGFRYNGSWLQPGRISNLVIASPDVRFGAWNARSAIIIPSRATCGLRSKDGSKMISGRGKVFLAC
jgi:hypothetical protein